MKRKLDTFWAKHLNGHKRAVELGNIGDTEIITRHCATNALKAVGGRAGAKAKHKQA